MKRFSTLPNTLLASAESTEIFDCLGNSITEQTQDDASTITTVDVNIEEDFVCNLLSVTVEGRERSTSL